MVTTVDDVDCAGIKGVSDTVARKDVSWMPTALNHYGQHFRALLLAHQPSITGL